MAVSHHLGILTYECCTIRSAVPENPTLKPNVIFIDLSVVFYWRYRVRIVENSWGLSFFGGRSLSKM